MPCLRAGSDGAGRERRRVRCREEVGGKAEFKTDAVILGNITASTITVLDGATIQGYVNTTFLQENSSSIFPDAISVTD